MLTQLWLESVKERDHFGYLRADKKINIEIYFSKKKKQDLPICSGFITQLLNLVFHKDGKFLD
jgi:hypothetical protein